MILKIINTIREAGLRVGVVAAEDVEPGPSAAALQRLLACLVEQRAIQEFPPPERKAAVRALLKSGGFKPSGRSKPASEYLAQAAREGRFPSINNLVDVNNYISLLSGLPASLLDSRALGGTLLLRFGLPGERYVFNDSAQEIDLNGLICACAGEPDLGTPLGNPVKDSMPGKVKPDTSRVTGVIYAPAGCEAELEQHASLFGQLLQEHCSARSVEVSTG